MRIISLFIILQCVIFAQAGSTLTLLMGGDVSYEAETLAYQSRVLADGGEIVDLAALNNFYINAKANDYLDSLTFLYASKFGLKKNANGVVILLYDVTANQNDAPQADTSKAATLNGNNLYFSGSDQYYPQDAMAIGSFYGIANFTGGANFTDFNGIFNQDGSTFVLGSVGSTVFYGSVLFYFNNTLSGDKDFAPLATIKTIYAAASPISSTTFEIGSDVGSRFWIGNINVMAGISTNNLSDAKRTALDGFFNSLYSVY